MEREKGKVDGEEVDDTFEVTGIKIEPKMDKNLQEAISKYNLVHNKFLEDFKAK